MDSWIVCRDAEHPFECWLLLWCVPFTSTAGIRSLEWTRVGVDSVAVLSRKSKIDASVTVGQYRLVTAETTRETSDLPKLCLHLFLHLCLFALCNLFTPSAKYWLVWKASSEKEGACPMVRRVVFFFFRKKTNLFVRERKRRIHGMGFIWTLFQCTAIVMCPSICPRVMVQSVLMESFVLPGFPWCPRWKDKFIHVCWHVKLKPVSRAFTALHLLIGWDEFGPVDFVLSLCSLWSQYGSVVCKTAKARLSDPILHPLKCPFEHWNSAIKPLGGWGGLSIKYLCPLFLSRSI